MEDGANSKSQPHKKKKKVKQRREEKKEKHGGKGKDPRAFAVSKPVKFARQVQVRDCFFFFFFFEMEKSRSSPM